MRKWFDNFLNVCRKWDVDKWVHIVAAIVVAWFIATAVNSVVILTGHHANRVLMGFVGLMGGWVFCILKEWYDKKTTNLWDEQDLAAGLVGLTLFFIIYSV